MGELNLLVERKWKKDTYTVGRFYVAGAFFGNSMEDKDRGFDKSMPLKAIQLGKVYGKTAIPTGTYIVKLTFSPKFMNRAWGEKYGGLVPEIMDVPAFSGVRIHPLNCAEDSLGCIGVGKNDKKGWISKATKYYYDLMDNYLMPAHKRGETITINIK
ncbi:MAG: hypothetical protein II891_06730 [Bacteroidales bacterium]|nr:hypothetical protein [Bacteroidales bacterium]